MINKIEEYFKKEMFLKEPVLSEEVNGPYACQADMSPLEHLYRSIQKISNGEDLSETERLPLKNHFIMFDELRAEAHELLSKVVDEQQTLRNLVERLVIYAENLPVGEYDKACGARCIADALLAKGYNDYIPSEVKREFSGRLDALKNRPLPQKKTAHIAPPSDETSVNKPQTEYSTEEERPKLRKNNKDTRKGRYLIFPSLEQQQYWAQVFVDFLKAHNKSQESLSTEAANYINRTFACFHQQWKKHKLLNKNAFNKAYTLFLTNDCGIDGIAEKTYSNNVDKTLTKALEYENRSTASTMLIKIEELVKKEAELFTT